MPGSLEPGNRPGDPQSWMRYSHLGVQFAMTFGVITYAGYWADTRLGSSPAFTLLGTAAGFGIGFYHLYREVYRPGGPGARPPRGKAGSQ